MLTVELFKGARGTAAYRILIFMLYCDVPGVIRKYRDGTIICHDTTQLLQYVGKNATAFNTFLMFLECAGLISKLVIKRGYFSCKVAVPPQFAKAYINPEEEAD